MRYTEGFNPKPRLEFAHPLGLGVSSEGEVASVDLLENMTPKDFIQKLNKVLPEGLSVNQAALMSTIEEKMKRPSLMALYGGGEYILSGPATKQDVLDQIPADLLAQWSHISLSQQEKGGWYIKDNLAVKKGSNSNIRKFLAALLGEDFLNTHTLHRIKLYAQDKKGNSAMGYFEMLSDK